MERARVFKTSGAIRILYGLSFWELLIMFGVSFVVMQYLHAHPVVELIAFALSMIVSLIVQRFFQDMLKPAAATHFLTWLTQADAYHPMSDSKTYPLVYGGEDEASH
jgi:hypothetical protein